MINLLPNYEKKSIRREYILRLSSVCFILLSVACFFVCILLAPSYFFSLQKKELAENRLSVWNLQNKDVTLLDVSTVIGDTNEKLRLLMKSSMSRVSDERIGRVLALRSDGITYSNILYREQSDGLKTLELRGQASDRTKLRAFKEGLEKSSLFSSVNVPISNFLERSGTYISVSLLFK